MKPAIGRECWPGRRRGSGPGAAAGAHPHLPGSRFPPRGGPAGPRSRRRQRRGAAAGRPPGRAGGSRRPRCAAPAGSWPSCGPVGAVVAADTPMLILAAAVAARMGLAHNPVEAVIAAADKAGQRHRWAHAVAQPAFRVVPAAAAEAVLGAGRGTGGIPLRGQGGVAQRQPGDPASRRPRSGRAAARRIRHVLARRPGGQARAPAGRGIRARAELSIDGLLDRGPDRHRRLRQAWHPRGPHLRRNRC